MFTELKKQTTPLPFGGAELWLRFDNSAFLKIENAGFDPFDIKAMNESGRAARVFLEAGLADCFKGHYPPALAKTVNDLLRAENTAEIFLAVKEAVLSALPPPKINTGGGKSNGLADLFSFWCDVMRKPEADFWNATLREITQRCERYQILKGYKKAPLQIKRFDDE